MAQPGTGSWTAPDDFDPGEWQELLWGGSEGAPGNEITASSPGVFAFGGAILDTVTLLSSPTPEAPYFQYETIYLGGEVTLANLEGTPWYNPCDPATRLPAELRRTRVTTWKYVEGERAGQMDFRLETLARFVGHGAYIAQLVAGFRGIPEEGMMEPDGPAYIAGELTHVQITILGPVNVPVDIKPGSCPNPVNCRSRGVLPVAIAGSRNLRPRMINPRTVTLAGVRARRYAVSDVTTPYVPACDELDAYDCQSDGPDGIPDMTFKFNKQAVLRSLGPVADGDVLLVELQGRLWNQTPFKGSDVIVIRCKGKER
jgi:hypothetical protein